MAKKSVIARNKKRALLGERYRKRREELVAILKAHDVSLDDKLKAQFDLQKLPRDSSRTRYRVRCEITGRGRGNYRKYRLSRIKLRELFVKGEIPGLVKSSW